MIIDNIRQFIDAFSSERITATKATKDLKSWKLLNDELPIIIRDRSSLSDEYLITGSIGKGLISETPWIGIFDKQITESAQSGFYIVYLFRSDLSGFYLSLNQGWTQYETNYGIKEGRETILQNAIKAQELLKGTLSFSFDSIDLKAARTLAKGYELGNICSKYYSMDSLPNDSTFVDDLRNLIGVYRELKGIVGKDILEMQNKITEDEFQAKSQEGKVKKIPNGPIPRKEKGVQKLKSGAWSRDSNISYTALLNAHFECENDNKHETFICADDDHNFMEAHHLIPMEFQKDFVNSLDVPENIICLCPNCHRGFHLANEDFKKAIISKFYELRIKMLVDRGLYVAIEKLIEFYH